MECSSDGFVSMSPEELEKLQKYAEYSTKTLQDVLLQFYGSGELARFNQNEHINFDGFQAFMNFFLDTKLPEEFCKHIFCSFQKNNDNPQNSSSKKIKSFEDEGIIFLKDVACHLSLLKGGTPKEKLQFVFNLYDTDGNGYLDNKELEGIVNQMMHFAKHLGWDVSELRPILYDMLEKIDFDKDGVVSLEEWIQGGMTNIPLLVLLGLENGIRDDGIHSWRMKHFKSTAYCNFCQTRLVGVGKQGLACRFCKYTAHERCVDKVPDNCIHTYSTTTRESGEEMKHFWIKGNHDGPCHKCKKAIKSHQGLVGKHCRWCQLAFHENCAVSISEECNLGDMRPHVLHPCTICPGLLQEQKNKLKNNSNNDVISSEATNHDKPAAKTNSKSTEGQSLHINPLCNTHPLLVFVNPKSGGKQGIKLLTRLQCILNPRQVYDLTDGGPMPGINFFRDLDDFRILCCGGDGTVGWVLDSIDKSQIQKNPPVAILPLGTGNDLARCMRWGGGYEGGSVLKFLQQIEKSEQVNMDRWLLNINSQPDVSEHGDPAPLSIINNYFSIGVDASICRKFHMMREKHPEKFSSRTKNKLWYSAFGTTETFAASCKKLYESLEVEVDGVPLQSWSKSHFQGIAILNIPSVYGGTNLWGTTKKQKSKKKNSEKNSTSNFDLKYATQELGDQKLEIVGVEGAMDVGQIITGLKAGKRLAQGCDINITTKKVFPMQVDGEPWMQAPCQIKITHKNQVPMLMAPTSGHQTFFSRLRGVSLNGDS